MMFTVVQAASGDNFVQSTVAGIVEADELRSLPFVDPAVPERPACPAVRCRCQSTTRLRSVFVA
jgi:hypothetical protein